MHMILPPALLVASAFNRPPGAESRIFLRYSVFTQRRREIRIRIAVGATNGREVAAAANVAKNSTALTL
jgi:hypothetical protein